LSIVNYKISLHTSADMDCFSEELEYLKAHPLTTF